MHQTVYKYVTWIWMAALLSSTIGISVHKIYCYCVGTTTLSLFVGDEQCGAQQAAPIDQCCEKSAAKSCCEKPDHSKNGCTKKSTEIYQLKAEFLVEQVPVEKSFEFPAWFQEMPMFKHLTRSVLCDVSVAGYPQPPPLSGRDICLLYSNIRC